MVLEKRIFGLFTLALASLAASASAAIARCNWIGSRTSLLKCALCLLVLCTTIDQSKLEFILTFRRAQLSHPTCQWLHPKRSGISNNDVIIIKPWSNEAEIVSKTLSFQSAFWNASILERNPSIKIKVICQSVEIVVPAWFQKWLLVHWESHAAVWCPWCFEALFEPAVVCSDAHFPHLRLRS